MEKVKRKKVYLTQYPHLIAEWHPEKNGDLDPSKITHGSDKKVWWLCANGHEWESTIYNRSQAYRNCPYCSGRRPILGETDLESQRPDLAKEWSSENDKGPNEVSVGSGYRAIWVCSECAHEWVSVTYNRSKGSGCPVCAGHVVKTGFNDLASICPHLVAEWSPKNNKGVDEVTVSSRYRAIWICSGYGHEWVSAVYSRTRGYGCPVCAGKKVLRGFNDLATTHPELAAEWSPKNGDLTPEMVISGSHKKIEWVCGDGHSWGSTVYNRALYGNGCPKCCLQRTSNVEAEVFRLLTEQFPDAEQGVQVGRWSIDVLLSRRRRVAIEYDGSYFHRDYVDRDTRKTLDLLSLGYRVVRIRERSGQNALPFLNVDNPHYLELTYDYSRDWSGLSDIVEQITEWVGE